jgi:hypothetical protein
MYFYVCVYVYRWVGGRRSAGVGLRACSLTYPVCQAQAPNFLRSQTLPYFPKLSHELHDFRKKISEHKMCAFTFSTNII